MNLQAFLNSKALRTFSEGIIKVLLTILVYRLLVEQLESNWKYRLFTLILIVTPIVLYLTMKKLVATQWNYQVKFIRMLSIGIIFTLVAGFGIATLDYLILVFKVPGFHTSNPKGFQIGFVRFVLNYLTWYALIGTISSPIVYLVIKWQLRNTRIK